MTTTTFLSPPSMPPTRGYTQIVESQGPCRTIYLSGQLGLTKEGQFAGADFRSQVTQCFENVKTALRELGAGFEHVVKITNYFTDMSDLPTFFEVRDSYVNTKAPPAGTAVQVVRLALPRAVFELEAIAVVPITESEH